MAYDMHSQEYERCLAMPNSALFKAEYGLHEYLRRGVPRQKLVLGVPWFGFDYPCTAIETPTSAYCETKPAANPPWANCSDVSRAAPACRCRRTTEAAYCGQNGAGEPGFASIMHTLKDDSRKITGLRWDNFSASPFFNYNSSGQVRQVWFDNAESLRMKYAMAKELGILGVGPFEFSSVDPLSPEAREMWQAFDVFLKSDDNLAAEQGSAPVTHPRLYFAAEDLPALRQKAKHPYFSKLMKQYNAALEHQLNYTSGGLPQDISKCSGCYTQLQVAASLYIADYGTNASAFGDLVKGAVLAGVKAAASSKGGGFVGFWFAESERNLQELIAGFDIAHDRFTLDEAKQVRSVTARCVLLCWPPSCQALLMCDVQCLMSAG
jgi:hypothetical protein